jgi:uncharacterized integral membrane protein
VAGAVRMPAEARTSPPQLAATGRVASVDRDHEVQPRARRSNWRPWVLGVAVILIIILVAQNSQKVKVKFLFVDTTTPLIFALLIAAVLGAVVGYVAPVVRRHRRGD